MTIGPITRAVPRLGLSLDGIRPRGRAWAARWRIRNGSAVALRVTEAWHPHGRFRSSRLRRDVRVAPGSSATIDVPARIDVREPGIVENCFLILRLSAGRDRFRVLARFTLRIGDVPDLTVEAVDVHPAER